MADAIIVSPQPDNTVVVVSETVTNLIVTENGAGTITTSSPEVYNLVLTPAADNVISVSDPNPGAVVVVQEVNNSVSGFTQGPPGTSAETIVSVTAGEALGGQRVVYLVGGNAFYADNSNIAAANRSLGVTRTAATLGAPVEVITQGRQNGFSGLTPGEPYYLSANGTITPTVPTTGVLQQVGVAMSTTELVINVLPSTIMA